MKRFVDFRSSIQEIVHNTTTRDTNYHPDVLGNEVPAAAEHIGTLANGHQVYHHSPGTTDSEDGMHMVAVHNYYVADPKTKKVNIALTTHDNPEKTSESIHTLSGNKDSLGAEHLYKHLVLNHNKILTSSSQSSGARHVWDKASKHPKINVHAYDPSSDELLHHKSKDDENYTSDIGGISNSPSDFAKNIQDKRSDPDNAEKYNKDYKELRRVSKIQAVMHKK